MLRSIFRVWPAAVGALALTVACSCSGARGEVMTAPSEPVSPLGIANAGASSAVRPVPVPAAPVEVAAPSDARALGSSPMQAIEQVVTAQALLVSLLLTPFSKDHSEQPVARVDAGPVDAARARASSSAR